MVEPVIARPLVLTNPADDPVLYTAADGKANVLCTRNIDTSTRLKRSASVPRMASE